MGRVIDAVDRGQQRFPVLGVPLAVYYKYLDDQGNFLAATIAYYAFIAIFPLLLLATSILGFLLQGNPDLQERILDSALSQFPIIGDELGRPDGLRGSTTGAIVGGLVALYGALGLGLAIQNAINQAWAVPRNRRPNPILLRLRSLLLLTTAGLALLGLTVGSALLSQTEVFGELSSYRWPIVVVTVVLVTLVLAVLLRLGAARRHPFRSALPGAFVVAVLWQTLQVIGTAYVTGVIAESEGMDETFAVVLGLIGLLWVAAVMGVLGMEVNVVLVRRLWPRALLTIVTDRVDLTEADKRAYASYAQMQRHKRYQHIDVTFGDRHRPARPDISPERSPDD
ncbi:YihY/virulence factor BrkB family protein [Nocardioides dongkuii]|uniref:YihY/virulence factor BrkB family protein n=1 Tax=Nocardioides dongkuii TaxID=2760089 RepID=UPI001878459D|nr:YihY/virulence factor BrkB family protein [Nocardioides dongkuii]